MNTTNSGLANVGLSNDGAGREGGSNNIMLGERKEKSISISSCLVDSTAELFQQSGGSSAQKKCDEKTNEVEVEEAIKATSDDVHESKSVKGASFAEEDRELDNDSLINEERDNTSDSLVCSSIEAPPKVNNNDIVSSTSSNSGRGKEESGSIESNNEKTQQSKATMVSETEAADTKQQITGYLEEDISIKSQQGLSNSIIPACKEEKELPENVEFNDVTSQSECGDTPREGSEKDGEIQAESLKSEENAGKCSSPELEEAPLREVDTRTIVRQSSATETNESSTESLQGKSLPHCVISDADKSSPKANDPPADPFVDGLIIPKSPSPTFASAFSDDNSSSEAPIDSSHQQAIVSTSAPVEIPALLESPERGSDNTNHDEVGHSQTAFGAVNKKKMNKSLATYLENVKQEQVPGSSIESPRCEKPAKRPISPQPSPKSHIEASVDTDALPGLKSVRERFEKNSKRSESNVFAFGEAFREKMKHKQLAEKEKFKEAKVVMHGFDEDEIATSPRSPGEVDTSNLEKNYVCQSNETVSLVDGRCRVDYEMRDYRTMVFIIHRSRGLILLQNQPGKGAAYTIPGGRILKDEFIDTAKQVGSRTEQLQSAAKQAAAREVFNVTGIDVREEVDRLVPAVLRSTSDMDSNGDQVARNDLCGCHFYFLTVSEEDFLQEAPDDNSSLSSPSAEPNSPYRLKLSDKIKGFEFVDNPVAAFKIMKEKGDKNASDALQIIIGHKPPSDMAENFHSLSQRNLFAVEKTEESSQDGTPLKVETAPESKGQPESERTKLISESKGQLVQPGAHKVESCCCILM